MTPWIAWNVQVCTLSHVPPHSNVKSYTDESSETQASHSLGSWAFLGGYEVYVPTVFDGFTASVI